MRARLLNDPTFAGALWPALRAFAPWLLKRPPPPTCWSGAAPQARRSAVALPVTLTVTLTVARLVTQTFEIVYWMMGVMLGWGAALSTVVMYIATYTNPHVCYRGGTLERVACYHDVDNAQPLSPLQRFLAILFALVWVFVTICQMTSAEYLSAHHLARTPRIWVRAAHGPKMGGLFSQKWQLISSTGAHRQGRVLTSSLYIASFCSLPPFVIR